MLISDLKPQDSVKGFYLCKYKQILKNKNGKDYCTVRLQDKSGLLDGKIWSMHSGISDFDMNDIVEVEGETLLYQENLQLNISKIRKAETGYELKDFIPQTKKDVSTLETELLALIEQVKSPFIKQLLEGIFLDNEIYDAFVMHSAGKSVHHAYLSGLLEHTISVAKIGVNLASLYDKASLDLVIAGCLLHDIGKLRELTAFPKNEYSDEGQLIGHLVIGSEMIHDMAKKIKDFPSETECLIKHIVIAHHGEYEYASPKRPKCIEAMIVHLADFSDSRLKMMDEMLEGSGDELYVGYHKMLERNIRKVKDEK